MSVLINRFVVFLIAFIVWFLLIILPNYTPSGNTDSFRYLIGYSIGFGGIIGIPVLVYAAIADGLAAVLFPKRPTIGFLLLAIVGILAYAAFIQSESGTPENKQAVWIGTISTYGFPVLGAIAVYTVATAVRTRWRRLTAARSVAAASTSPPCERM